MNGTPQMPMQENPAIQQFMQRLLQPQQQRPMPQAPRPPQVSYPQNLPTGQMSPPMAEAPMSRGFTPSIGGVMQYLGQWRQRSDMRKHAEAKNLVKNLVEAVNNGDQQTAEAIMGNPKNVALIDKAFPGWLTPDTKGQAKQTKAKAEASKLPDPSVTGAQAGLQAGLQQKPQGQSRSFGGRMIPQATPEMMLQRAQQAIELQAMQKNPIRALGMSEWDKMDYARAALQANLTGRYQAELVRGYYTMIRLAQQQSDMANRSRNLEDQRQENRKSLENIKNDHRKELVRLIKSFSGKNEPEKLQLQLLKAQSDETIKLRAQAQTAYNRALAAGDSDEATSEKKILDGYDKLISDYRSKMDMLQSQDVLEKGLLFILGAGEEPTTKEEEEIEETPEQ